MEKYILDKLHSEMLVIYKKIEEICLKHNLTFFVVGGTLIGAVVHKNYIPWDDDLDIAMPRDDYDRFMKIFKEEADDRFFLHNTESDENYWLPFAKVRLTNTVFLENKRKNVNAPSGIYVDIFPFDYAKDCNGGMAKAKWKLMTYLNNYIIQKVTGEFKVGISGKILNPIFGLFSIKKLSLFRDKIMRSFDKGQRNYYVDLAGGRVLSNSYFKIDSILPIVDMPFGDTTVKAPQNPDPYLTQLYTKKYLVIPPKDKQITHNPIKIVFEDGETFSFTENEI